MYLSHRMPPVCFDAHQLDIPQIAGRSGERLTSGAGIPQVDPSRSTIPLPDDRVWAESCSGAERFEA
jgi:hypothetical protein